MNEQIDATEGAVDHQVVCAHCGDLVEATDAIHGHLSRGQAFHFYCSEDCRQADAIDPTAGMVELGAVGDIEDDFGDVVLELPTCALNDPDCESCQ